MKGSRIDMKGDRELMRRLNNISKQSTLNKITRPAVRQASGEVRKVAKFYALSSKVTGLLRRSISNVVRTGKAGVYAVVGPAEGYKTFNPETNRYQDPANYAHFIELGTKPSPNRPFYTQPKPFLRPAIDSVDTRSIMARRAWKELAKEASRR